MKGYILVDIPVIDSVEIDEYGMVAEINLMPETMTMRKDLRIHIDRAEVRPLPYKRRSMVNWASSQSYDCETKIVTHEPSSYDQGWNDCVEFLEGEYNG